MDIPDPDDFIRPPNDGAYTKEEVRTGPFLDYVAEKIRHSLEGLHFLIHELRRPRGEDQSRQMPSMASPNSEPIGGCLFNARYAFKSSLVGFLALHNMLGLATEDELDERLLRFTTDEFQDWLHRIDEAGLVTG